MSYHGTWLHAYLTNNKLLQMIFDILTQVRAQAMKSTYCGFGWKLSQPMNIAIYFLFLWLLFVITHHTLGAPHYHPI